MYLFIGYPLNFFNTDNIIFYNLLSQNLIIIDLFSS